MSELIPSLTLMFVTASVLIFTLDRFKHPAIPAYILSGLLISNFVQERFILSLSQIGIAFLVFIFGVKMDLDRLKAVADESISAALIQVAVVGITAYIVAQGLGFNTLNTIYIASAAALSSSLVGLELIESEVRLDLLHGRLAESIQLIQDIIALFVITLLGTGLQLGAASRNLAQLFLIVGFALFVRKYLFGKIAELAAGSRELLMLLSLSFLTGFITLSSLTGASIVVGAFAAGLSVARFPQNMEILDTIGSLKDFFSAIFFIGLGALISIPGPTALLLTVFLISITVLLQPIITGLGLLINGYDKRTAYLTGLSLDQISEFALIIAIQAYIAGTIQTPVFQSIILAATSTMVISSYTSRFEEEIYRKISDLGLVEVNGRKINKRTQIPENLEDHVILVGYDTQGKEISEALRNEEQEFIIIENDPEKIIEASKQQEHYIFGDVFDYKTWRKAHLDKAKLIVSTIPQKQVSERILGLPTEADKILRSSEVEEAKLLLEQGAFYVNVPDILSGEELLDHLHGVMENTNYREEIRRRNLLEIRQQLQSED